MEIWVGIVQGHEVKGFALGGKEKESPGTLLGPGDAGGDATGMVMSIKMAVM